MLILVECCSQHDVCNASRNASDARVLFLRKHCTGALISSAFALPCGTPSRVSGANTVSVTLHTVTSMCSVMLQRFESRQVANVLWAIANLRDRQDELTRRLDARILQVQT